VLFDVPPHAAHAIQGKKRQAIDQNVHVVEGARQETVARSLVEQLVELLVDRQQCLVVSLLEHPLKVP